MLFHLYCFFITNWRLDILLFFLSFSLFSVLILVFNCNHILEELRFAIFFASSTSNEFNKNHYPDGNFEGLQGVLLRGIECTLLVKRSIVWNGISGVTNGGRGGRVTHPWKVWGTFRKEGERRKRGRKREKEDEMEKRAKEKGKMERKIREIAKEGVGEKT